MKNLLMILATALLLYGCSSTNLMTIRVTEPAPVSLPGYIKSVGIINRSPVSAQNEKMDKVDKVFSIEGKNLDKDGALATISGLKEELIKNPRFTAVKNLDKVDLRSPGFGVFPSPLSWETIDKVCRENQVDGLFVLEFYDTDSKISYAAIPTTIKTPLGDVPAVEQMATNTTLIKLGWRIYDTQAHVIVDEFPMSQTITLTGRGINPAEAASAIIGRKDAVNRTSTQIGENYATSILPYYTRVSRDYYVRGSDNFKTARRKAQAGNWDGAGELWKKETTNPSPKVAGRAHYNMAIISEINGNLDEAIQWASKAYEDYNNKLALRYIDMLNYRKQRNNELQRQQEQEQQK